jgi:hypothetical protein
MQGHLDVPDDFIKRVHRALRAWHYTHAKDTLTDLLLARQIAAAQATANARLITNQILLNGLESLKRSDADGADVLERRFPNEETAQEVGLRRNLSEDVVYQRQRLAIQGLARVIWTQEAELRQGRVRRIEAHLEPRTYSQLFGVAEKTAEVRAQLESNSGPWLIALDGLGGVGKTSLADALVRELASETRFHDIGWVSARRRLFQLSGQIEKLADQSEFTIADLVDRLIEQFDLPALKRRSDAEKLAGFRDFLKEQTCLVVVDNLETAADYHSLVSALQRLAEPSKFLITTRHALRHVDNLYSVTLKHLSPNDTLALIRHEAEQRGMHELADLPEGDLTQIYSITGGNPLATKLLIGQIHSLSLPIALSLFKAARGKAVEELLGYIHANAWQRLEQPCREILRAMTLVPEEGGRLEQIAAAVELDAAEAATCLQRLATLSLVNMGGDLQERRYSLHQLTQAFLAQQSSGDS